MAEQQKNSPTLSKNFAYNIKEPLSYPKTKDAKDTSIRSRHYIRFFINLDEESRYIKDKKVIVTGDVDQSEQARVRNKPLNQKVFNVSIGAAAAVKTLSTDMSGVFGNGVENVAAKAILAPLVGTAVASIADTIKIDKKLKRLATIITLYTPATIGMNQTANWENYDDVMYQLMQLLGDSSVGQVIANGGGAADLINAASDDMKKAGSVANTVGRIIATSASPTISSATRTAVNPRKDLLFKSVNRRDFTFDYQFAPRSAEESAEVANIIQTFRLFAAPEIVEGTDQFLMTFPAEFDIEYGFIDDTSAESENKYVNKISSCVLESIQVNYSPNGTFQTLENGDPVQINMTLHFKELETMHRDRIAKGY